MKIVAIDTTLGGNLIGGAQTFLVNLLNGLTNHELHLVSKGEPNKNIQFQCEVHTDLWNGLVDDATPVFAKWLNDQQPDVVVTSVSPDLGWTVLPLLDPQIATVTVTHSNDYGFYDPLCHYAKFVTRSVGVSDQICETIKNYCGVSRVDWIPYGVTPTEQITEFNDHLRLAYVGRLAEKDKKVSDLMKIWAKVRETGCSLRVIGDGPLKNEFYKQFPDDRKLEMVGRVRENKNLLKTLSYCEVALLVSESEGFSIALVEQMANGLCPIVTDIPGGNRQLVQDGENGFLVPVGDVDGFVEKIKYLANNRDELLKLRHTAWETGKQYSMTRMIENYEECFERAVEDARTTPRTVDPNYPLMESCRSKYPLWVRRLKARVRGA